MVRYFGWSVLIWVGAASITWAQAGGNAGTPRYKQASLSIDERVADLLSRMSLEEKAAQMICVWQTKPQRLLDDKGNFDLEKARQSFADKNGLGQVGRPSDAGGGKNARDMAIMTNAIQKFFVEETRLGIPVIYHEECLHGHKAIDAVSFPQPIGLAATWDTGLVQRVFELTAEEARCRGTHQALTPVVDVARDPRWGRVEETYGEDPYLVGELGLAAVKGFQGDGKFRDKKHVIATLKHFAAHGQPEGGTNIAPANISERTLRETFFYTFEQSIKRGGAMSVMASYNEIDGVPSHINRWLLQDVLRGQMKFNGFVVSDYHALRELADRPGLFGHHVARDGKEAATLALKAGVNIELPDPDVYLLIPELVRSGAVPEKTIDDLVRPMLAAKFAMGLFEDPYVDPDYAAQFVGRDENRKLALESAHKTITLLKRDPAAMPVNLSKVKTIAVIGPNANYKLLGGYSDRPKHYVTVLDGIKQYVGDRAKVVYSLGCKITEDAPASQHDIKLFSAEENRRTIAEAVKVAAEADVVILAVGGNEHTSREAYRFDRLGDRATLKMIGEQEELIDAIAATGKPIVGLVFGGVPYDVDNLCKKSVGVLECWFLGQETGRAVADVVFGDVNPGGKLPMTFPRSAGQLPAYYNYKPSARRGYEFDNISPLFPFGYGLSYTTFKFSPRLKIAKMGVAGSTSVEVDVTNTGDRAGDEVVQLYIRDDYSSVTRPVKELKGFERITLKPGETRTVSLPITPERLAFWNIDMKYVVEPGEFKIMTGPNSADLQEVTLTVE